VQQVVVILVQLIIINSSELDSRRKIQPNDYEKDNVSAGHLRKTIQAQAV
jgi:hypothetical protein